MLKFLQAKIHSATITKADASYEGSIGIDAQLLQSVGMLTNQYVEIYNITNGNRFNTYIISQPPGSGEICVNGAAARLVLPGDKVIICTYCYLSPHDAVSHKPKVIVLDSNNVAK